MQYYFNELDANSFQRLVSAILTARFGDDLRTMPLYGADGGRDAETAPGNPFIECRIAQPTDSGSCSAPRAGRYLFQVKHHRTVNIRLSDARKAVIADFDEELTKNVLPRTGDEKVSYFFLITNVPSSRDALEKLDQRRSALLAGVTNLHADVWWEDRLASLLDQLPSVWVAFPQLFAGGVVPLLGQIAGSIAAEVPRAVRMSIDRQYRRDSSIKFRQIDLEKSLSRLFVDLQVSISTLAEAEQRSQLLSEAQRQRQIEYSADSPNSESLDFDMHMSFSRNGLLVSALGVVLDESNGALRTILLEGGPGQGKSTVTQMAVQIYRQQVLQGASAKLSQGRGWTGPLYPVEPEGRWVPPLKSRLPFRIELRNFAEWLSSHPSGSVEEYLVAVIKEDSGGSQLDVDQIHDIVAKTPVLLVFDGLDEVGSDDMRDVVLRQIGECLYRFEHNLRADLRVVLTTRPPAIAGRQDQLGEFRRLPIAPLEPQIIEAYLDRWLSVQVVDVDDKLRIRASFERRQNEPHVQALARNPMQLSVLLHFIRLKGEAFPDRRAELYREYFKTVIDRDVEKSADLRQHRDIIEALHQFLGYKIHSLTEAQQADGTLSRAQLLRLVRDWLASREDESITPSRLFKLGEERLGLIAALRGEGEDIRYGYEIQPVREYFAAAFINDQIIGNAHDVLSALVRRAYWREVALFLAGLRRPNEKADLIVRARDLDGHEQFGWLQQGRKLVLQLLEEGVFSQPRHVFSEALEFVIDLLDTVSLPIQAEPADLPQALPGLLRQGDLPRQIDRLTRLIRRYQASSDEYAVYRLYRIASQVLDPQITRDSLYSFSGTFRDAGVKTRLIWPYSWGISMFDYADSADYWQVAEDAVWAENWWATALRNESAMDLPGPVALHQYLLEQFAANPLSWFTPGSKPQLRKPSSTWAVWWLLRQHRAITEWPLRRRRSGKPNGEDSEYPLCIADDTLSFAGLDPDWRAAVEVLLGASNSLLTELTNSRAVTIEVLEPHIPKLVAQLQQPGLIGWLTCRCAKNLLSAVLSADFEKVNSSRFFAGNRTFIDHLRDRISQSPDLQALWIELTRYYEHIGPRASEEISDPIIEEGFSAIYRTSFHRSVEVLPTNIRREKTTPLTPLVTLISEQVCSGLQTEADWLARFPLTTRIVRPLVEACRKSLPELIALFGKLRFVQVGVGPALLARDKQRILNEVRSSEREDVLAGAFIALSTTSYLASAGTELFLKLIRANQARYRFVVGVFEKDSIASRNLSEADRSVLDEAALEIMKSPHVFGSRIVFAAANYVADHAPINFPPLLEEEDDLGLHVRPHTV
jgi:hypothetical protein